MVLFFPSRRRHTRYWRDWSSDVCSSDLVLGFLCGGETWTRVAGPIPSSPANSMAKGGPKTAGAPRPAAPQTTTATAPKTTAPVNPAPKAAPGQKLQATAQPADTVGDICLLPDIAGFTH